MDKNNLNFDKDHLDKLIIKLGKYSFTKTKPCEYAERTKQNVLKNQSEWITVIVPELNAGELLKTEGNGNLEIRNARCYCCFKGVDGGTQDEWYISEEVWLCAECYNRIFYSNE